MPIAPITSDNGSKRHGSALLDPLLQDGATLAEDGMGLRVLNYSFQLKDNESPGSFNTPNLPKFGQEAITGSRMYVSKRSRRYMRDGTIMFDIEAVGIDPDYGDTTEIMIEGASTASAEPIETHPDFQTKLAGTKAQPLNGAIFDGDGKFLGFSTDTSNTKITAQGGNPLLAGVRSYLSPRNTKRCYLHTTNRELMSKLISMKTGITSRNGIWNGVVLLPVWSDAESVEMMLTSITTEPICIQRGGAPVLLKASYEIMEGGEAGWNDLVYK